MTYSPSLHKDTEYFAYSLDRCVVLLPICAWSVYAYGARALFITLFSLLFGVGVYAAYLFALRKPMALDNILDVAVSAAVFSFTLPASVPYYVPIFGGVLCALPTIIRRTRKMFFGGFFASFAVRLIFPSALVAVQAFKHISPWIFIPSEKDLNPFVTYTPLQLLADDKVSSGTLLDQLFGTISGNIGEICGVILIIAFIFLALRKRIRIAAPLLFVFAFTVTNLILPKGDSEAIFYALVSLLSGGAILAAVFVFSDNRSLPITEGGKIWFALGVAVITVLLRYTGLATDGVYFAVTVMGLATPLIEKLTLPVAYGRTKVKKGKK